MKLFNLKMLLVACTVVSAYSVKAEGADVFSKEQLDKIACMIKGHTDSSWVHDRIPNMIAKLLSLPIKCGKAVLGFPVTCAKAVGNGCMSAGSSVTSGVGSGLSSVKNGCGSAFTCLKENKKTVGLAALVAAAIVSGSYVVHQLCCPAVKQLAEIEAQLAQARADREEMDAEFAI